MSAIALPPIMRTIDVEAPVERAFRVFTGELATWWPLGTHSVGGERAETAVLEPRVGGRIYERWTDGTESVWGEVLVWEPGSRIVLSWKPNRGSPYPPTEVEVRFEPRASGTRVVLEHRGWDALGDVALETRSEYDREDGWPDVLDFYRRAAAAD